ncbi:hypothetical protein CR513_23200, partial [Mucuna pruriens]
MYKCLISRHTSQNRIKNECIREKVEIAYIVENMVESRSRWFGHVWRRPAETPIRKVAGSPITRDDNEFEEVNIVQPNDFYQARDGDGGS